jgi:hypothetical protein
MYCSTNTYLSSILFSYPCLENHVGNIAFRDLIEKWRPDYDCSERKILKTSIASEIVNIIQQKHKGRFLERFKGLDGGVGWMEVDDKRAREKVALCFRSKRRHDNVMRAAAATSSASNKTADNSDFDTDGNDKASSAKKRSKADEKKSIGRPNKSSEETKKSVTESTPGKEVASKGGYEGNNRPESVDTIHQRKSYEDQDAMELDRMHLQGPPTEILPTNIANSANHPSLIAAFARESQNPALVTTLAQDQPHPALMEALTKEQYYRNLAIQYMLNPPPPPAAAASPAAPAAIPGSTGNPASNPLLLQYYLQQRQQQEQEQQHQQSNPYLYNGVLNYPRPN